MERTLLRHHIRKKLVNILRTVRYPGDKVRYAVNFFSEHMVMILVCLHTLCNESLRNNVRFPLHYRLPLSEIAGKQIFEIPQLRPQGLGEASLTPEHVPVVN
jgi:hypothetical protein